MAFKLLQVLVLGVIAAAGDEDVPITWVPSPRASLQCEVPGIERIPFRRPPPPLEGEERPRGRPYLWRHDGEEYKRYFNGTLEVSRRKDSEGLYQCAVRHPAGLVLGYPVRLQFAYMEKQFSVHPVNATAWRGQPYVLNCDISSGPPAAISWLRDGEPLPEDTRFNLLNNQLIITSVTYEDAGLYRCRASNALANKSKTSHGGRLQVEEPPADLASYILPVHLETDMVVARGSRVVLPCPVVGNPKPGLIWEMTPPGMRTGELESTEEILIMPNIELDQEGVYVCKMEGDQHLVKTFNVTIALPVSIINPPESKQVLRASTVRFNCTAIGSPTPNVTWYKDGKLLKLTGRIKVVANKKHLQLMIIGATSEDAGVYQCFARSGQYVAGAWGALNVTGVETAAPPALRCWPAGARDVVLRWGNLTLEVVAYTVYYSYPDGEALPWLPVESQETMINLKSSLTPYNFQVQAFIRSPTGNKFTANSVSNMSETVTCQGQGVPIKLERVADDAIMVSWQAFYKENPGVVQWILQHKAQNSSVEHNVTLDGHIFNYILHVELEAQQVRVLGTRSLPWLQQNLTLVPWTSTSSAARSLPPGEVPAVPEDVEVTEVNPRNFTVRWRCQPPGLSGGASLTTTGDYSYVVCTRRVGGNEHCQESFSNSVQVVELEPDSKYDVRVQARLPGSGQNVGGDFSAPIHINTPNEGQQNFRNLTYKYINMTTVRVSWNSQPRQYTVRYTSEYSLPHNQWAALEANGNTVLLTGLDPTMKLFVIVEGQEPVGHSPVLTVPAQIPEAKDIQFAYSADGVLVTWLGGGPRTVRYTQNLSQPLDAWPAIYAPQDSSSVQITGLDPTLRTYVMVAAPGPSPRSQVLTIKPRPVVDNTYIYFGVGIGCAVLMLLVVAAAVIFILQKRRRRATPVKARWRNASHYDGTDEEGSNMTNIGGRLANGGGSRGVGAGEPLLNGHVRITENPTQLKTPNGKVRRDERYDIAFDVSRFDDGDITLETVLDPDTSASTTYNLLDTSRRPEFDSSRLDIITASDITASNIPANDITASDIPANDIPANDSYNKLPDDNMNSELTRSELKHIDSKVVPTLQPNG